MFEKLDCQINVKVLHNDYDDIDENYSRTLRNPKNYISRTNEDNAELLLYAHSLTKAKPEILPKL